MEDSRTFLDRRRFLGSIGLAGAALASAVPTLQASTLRASNSRPSRCAEIKKDAAEANAAKATLSGQVGWWTRLPKWGKGRLMVSSPQNGMARSYSCGTCAALCNFGAYLDPFADTFVGVGAAGPLGDIYLKQCLLSCTQQCGGTPQGPSTDATYRWTSTNTSIATVSSGATAVRASFKGVAAGSATGHFVATDGQCTTQGNGPVTVFDLGVLGKNYILVGTDPNVQLMNQFQVTNAAHNNAPQPPGGTSSASSSDSSDTVSQVPGDNPPSFQFGTVDQSASAGDRVLTFKYTLSGDSATVQQSVTARKFAFLTNNSPSNQCTLGYGTNRIYIYSVYTHPDGQILSPPIAEGTIVTESFNPSLTCGTVTSNGSLHNAQIQDQVAGCSNKPLTCAQTSTQTISVAG